MRALYLFKKLTLYYGTLGIIGFALFLAIPDLNEYIPFGGAQTLLIESSNDPFVAIQQGRDGAKSFSGSVICLFIASCSAALVALPVAWIYIASRKRNEFDTSIVRTILILPIILTSIVLMVHNSLALAFSLAGIVGAVRFRNTLKSPGDALYVLMAIGIGLAAGIGAVEISITMTIVVNYFSVILWQTQFGAPTKTKSDLRSPVKKSNYEGGNLDEDGKFSETDSIKQSRALEKKKA